MSVGQTASGQRTADGFSSMLAAAQGRSSTPQSAAGELPASGRPVAEGAGVGINLNVRMLAPGNPQLKKLLSSPPVMLSTEANVKIVVPEFIPSQILSPPPPQLSLL